MRKHSARRIRIIEDKDEAFRFGRHTRNPQRRIDVPWGDGRIAAEAFGNVTAFLKGGARNLEICLRTFGARRRNETNSEHHHHSAERHFHFQNLFVMHLAVKRHPWASLE